MKKHTLVLSVFILSFIFYGFLGFNINSAGAANCAPGDLFNSSTGERCSSSQIVTCTEGDLFSAFTGERCTAWTNNSASAGANLRIGSRGPEVLAFQQTLANAGYDPGPIDGIYGPKTEVAAESYYKRFPVLPPPCPPGTAVTGVADNIPNRYICEPVAGGPVISGIGGPQSLNVNQTGTWKITAYDSSGEGNLSYSVNWGDEQKPVSLQGETKSSSPQQSASFTHSYGRAGAYTPIFTVTNSSGQSAEASLSVNVGGGTISNSINVLSPNGGEAWKKGTREMIKWQDNTDYPAICLPGSSESSCVTPERLYDISLQPTCAGDVCTLLYREPYQIAKSVRGFSYEWSVGQVISTSTTSQGLVNSAPDGAYKILVCHAGSSTCDSSDSYFKITAGSASDISPTISSLSPASGPIDTQVTIHGRGFTATGNRIKFGDLGSENNPNYNLNSADGKTLIFPVPMSNYYACWDSTPACGVPARMTQPGAYEVSVINENGTSKAVSFKVTSSSTF